MRDVVVAALRTDVTPFSVGPVTAALHAAGIDSIHPDRYRLGALVRIPDGTPRPQDRGPCPIAASPGCRGAARRGGARMEHGRLGTAAALGKEPLMHAKKGDWLVVESSVLDRHSRRGIILDVEGPDGTPPFLVRWEDNGHETLVFPGPDAHIAAAGTVKVE